jgi:hypothetical protein
VTISDVIKRCLSNWLEVNSNGKYRLYQSGTGILMEKGYLNYNGDIKTLEGKIKAYKYYSEHDMKYTVKIPVFLKKNTNIRNHI